MFSPEGERQIAPLLEFGALEFAPPPLSPAPSLARADVRPEQILLVHLRTAGALPGRARVVVSAGFRFAWLTPDGFAPLGRDCVVDVAAYLAHGGGAPLLLQCLHRETVAGCTTPQMGVCPWTDDAGSPGGPRDVPPCPWVGCCESDDDCDEGSCCVEGMCYPSNTTCCPPCPPGHECIDGQCEPCAYLDDDCCGNPDPCCDVTCDDGNPCTTDACVGGDCQYTAKDCDDGDPCTDDACVDGNCQHTPKDCDDGDACTIDSCVDGNCQHTPKHCDDGDPCTTDECVAGNCQHTAKDCDDGEVCTDDVCENGECTHPDRCDDVYDRTDWIPIDFEGIGDRCDPDCNYAGASAPITTYCGDTLLLTCSRPGGLGACSWEYWFNGGRVGLCVYPCGFNWFEAKFNNEQFCRVVATRHLVHDDWARNPAACDRGTLELYDWQVYTYDISSGPDHYCLEGPAVYWDVGYPSACEYEWW